MRVIASDILRLISYVWSPFAEKMAPRYLNRNTFFSSFPSHSTFPRRRFCFASSLSSRTRFTAHVPSKFCVSGCIWQWRLCNLTPLSLAQGLSHSGHRTPGQPVVGIQPVGRKELIYKIRVQIIVWQPQVVLSPIPFPSHEIFSLGSRSFDC